jgi:hypothetical protein
MRKEIVFFIAIFLVASSLCGCVGDQKIQEEEMARETFDTECFDVIRVYVPAEYGKAQSVSIDRGSGGMALLFENGDLIHIKTGSLWNTVIEVIPKKTID